MNARLAVPAARVAAGLLLAALALLACEDVDEDEAPEPAQTSPNARIVPAPLLSGKSLVNRPQPSAAGTRGVPTALPVRPPPVPFSITEAPTADTGAERSIPGFVLTASFSWPGRGRKVPLHGLSSDEVTDLRTLLGRNVTVDLTNYDRMRLVFDSDTFPLPFGASLLARHDRKGHLLLWPDERTFRVLPEGALRALFRERRVDVTPALSPLVEPGKTGYRFDSDTEVVHLTTAHGRVRLEQVPVQELGFGGALLCRLLLEFIAASPPSEVCRDDTIPVRAEFSFDPAGELVFSVETLRRKTDVPAGTTVTRSVVLVPPSTARFAQLGLPPLARHLLGEEHVSALRAGPPDGPTVAARAKNPSHVAAYVLLDDTPVAILPPRQKRTVGGLREGRYQLSSLTFFGELLQEPTEVVIPGPLTVAKPGARFDAGSE